MTRETILRIAAAAQCDPRTVQAWASGGNVRPLLRERIEASAKLMPKWDAEYRSSRGTKVNRLA